MFHIKDYIQNVSCQFKVFKLYEQVSSRKLNIFHCYKTYEQILRIQTPFGITSQASFIHRENMCTVIRSDLNKNQY